MIWRESLYPFQTQLWLQWSALYHASNRIASSHARPCSCLHGSAFNKGRLRFWIKALAFDEGSPAHLCLTKESWLIVAMVINVSKDNWIRVQTLQPQGRLERAQMKTYTTLQVLPCIERASKITSHTHHVFQSSVVRRPVVKEHLRLLTQ